MEKMTIEIIAEISGCHGGNLENAKKLIVEAHIAGATGVKFQCFQPGGWRSSVRATCACAKITNQRMKGGRPISY